MLLLVAVLMFVNYQDVIFFFFFKEDNGVGAAVCTYA